MKLHLNLSLRRALLAAMAAVATFASPATAGLVDARYDLQYYLDFGYNMGLFHPGATNITVPFKDGTSVSNATIPLMPNLDSYALRASQPWTGEVGGGAGLVAPQYVISATHCKEGPVYFVTESGEYDYKYTSTGYVSQPGPGVNDWSIQRLDKIVTEVAYTPYASDDFMRNSMTLNETWLYRTGQGDPKDTNGGIATGRTPLGGLCNLSSISQNSSGTWVFRVYNREFDTPTDTRPPLEISMTSGDSGSPIYAWDDANNQFVQVGFCSAGNSFSGYTGDIYICYNPTGYDNFIDSCEVKASNFSGKETILWGAQDATTGKGFLTQGSERVEYTGAGSANTTREHLGLTFSTADSVNTQTIELQGSVNMGAGAMTFDEGSWKLTEKNGASTFNSAGFIVNGGADLTLELTASANEEWRKVGEGIMTIAGSGNNEAVLRIGGGNTVYHVTRDEEGNITGCTLGNLGETRLDRDGGYAASSIRLEAGVASIVLMRDGQFKTNSVAGDTFTFGNAGGLLNLNGHDLTWGVINQDGSGKGARIGNMTTQDGATPGKASTFTYTGTGTFAGCFMDEGSDSSAKLSLVYNNTAKDASWTLTGKHDIAGGYTVKAGTLVLQGTPTPHSFYKVSDDWDFARMQGSDVTVESGAAFQLSHHAILVGNVTVENGGKFIINQVVNADSEASSGDVKENMAGKASTSMTGNVVLKAAGSSTAQMVADVSSSAITTLNGDINIEDPTGKAYNSISLTKTGNGILSVTGKVNVYGAHIEEGGLVVGDASIPATDNWYKWTIGEKGFLAAVGIDDVQFYLNRGVITNTSNGVLALTADQAVQLTGTAFSNGLYIGAWGDVSYGISDAELTAYNGAWRLGGGSGTLTVNFKLTGDNDLIIGNEWSSGTVHLTNENNMIGGEIIIKGTGNMLTYESVAALGNARVNLSYGNAIALHQQRDMALLNDGAQGVIAVVGSFDLDTTGYDVAIGAAGDVTFTGALTVGDTYRFGGSGNLTLDTGLDGSKAMKIDGMGTTGSSVTFAREDAYTGSITAGGGLELAEANSRGSIGIHVAHGEALASVAAMELQKGATLYMDGQSMEVRNLTALTGSAICNNGENDALLVLNVSGGKSTSIADGVLDDNQNSKALHIVKSGTGTLTMGTNASWTGDMIISQGTVIAALSGSAYINAAGGIGNASSVITLEKEGTLQLVIGQTNGSDRGKLGSTLLPQTVLGSGTIVMASGGEVLFSQQQTSFNGTIQLKDNTRLYVGDIRGDIGYDPVNNLKALAGSTIVVESGSQAKVTNTHRWGKQAAISTTANFTISGVGYAGAANWNILASRLTEGALAIDNNSTVYGNITLAGDAMISSSSAGTLEYYSPMAGLIPGDVSSYPSKATYGVKEHLGGNIRGLILGEGKTLSFGGNEGMTITADSANTYGNLVIANGNGHNTDQFALRLNGGKAVSQTSTALGKGHVTLSDGLILRLAGTGTANQADVEYTYANNIATGNGSTIQSYNITNKLTGTVSMADTLNLATANGGVLNLAGGVSGSGTLNIGAASKVILGDGISSTVTFGGNVVAGAGADFTLESASSLATNSTITGTDSLTLHLSGTSDYTLGGIAMSGTNSALTLHFDFTQAGSAEYITLNSSIASSATSIAIDLNMFNDITEGNYTLVNGSLGNSSYTLADTYGDRLSLVVGDGTLTLKVGSESRLYWASDSASQEWNSADNNWLTGNKGENTAFSGTTEVMFTASGLSTAGTRESISVSNALAVGKVNVSSQYEMKGEGSLNGTKLAVGDGGDLKLGVNAAFSEGVQVNDGTLTVEGKTLTANVSAENGAAVNLNGTTLKGNIMVDSESAVNMDAASITGAVSTPASGSIALTNARLSGTFSTDSGAMVLNAEDLVLSEGSFESSAQLKAGSITVAGGAFTLKAASDIETLAVNAGQTATLYNSAEESGKSKKFGVLQLADNATLAIDNRANTTSESGIIGTLQIGGNATIKETYGSGHLTIDTLTLADGVTSGTINLHKSSTNGGASYTAMFDIGSATAPAGNFVGEVVLANTVNHPNNPKHSVFINLYGKETLAHAVVKMNEQKDSGAYLGLGINADNARIGGLESSSSLGNRVLLFSGYAPQNIGWNTGDGPDKNNDEVARTLIIDTAENAAYTYHGQVRENLSLVKDGAGKQTFSGNSANFNGSIEILDGTLAFTGDALGMLGTASSVAVNGGTLDISSYDFSSGSLTVNNFSFSEDSVLALGNLTAETTYDFFTADSQLDNWTALTTDNFTIGGVSLSDMGRVSLSLGLDGSFSYTIDSWDLVWNGGASGTWEKNSSAETWMGGAGSEQASFVNCDSVSFNSSASLTVAEGVIVQKLDVQQGAELTTEGGLTILGDLSVADGAKWTLAGSTEQSLTSDQLKNVSSMVIDADASLKVSDNAMGGYAEKNLSGTGTVELGMSDTWTNKVQLGEGFKGETYISRGQFDLSDMQVGKTLRLADGVDSNSASAKTTVTANLILEGESIVHANSNKDITYSGTVTGENGVFISNGGGAHTFNAAVDLKELRTGHSTNTTTFTSATHFDKASISQATVNFNGTTTLDELVVSGGTANLAGTTTIGTVSHSNGNIVNTGTTNITARFHCSSGGNLQAKAGELTLSYAGADGNSVYTLDGSMSGTARGTVKLAENVSVSATYVYGTNGSEIHLANGARLKHNNSTEISNQGAGVATLKSTGSGQVYNIDNATFELANAHVKTSRNNVELKNKLIDSSVENAGTGTLTINNSGNTLTGLHATGGNINVSAAASLDLTNLVIAAQKSITAAAAMSVDSLAQFESGATLNADLTLATGATVNLGGEDFTLNGALTLQTGLTLGGNALEAVKGLTVGESYTLFSGVTNLQLEQAVTLNNMRSLAAQTNEAVSYKSQINEVQAFAEDYFSNLGADSGFMLSYNGGTVSITRAAAIPEPTTATLSLLALSALAARRRRK